ncbi:MAG: enoyl-CoA hydratase-related protein, partial [Dehalococcoidia bacterium]|nr:enoyl-CoA hydratase-related protein [Dehalococcoidia bacterium]
PDQRNSVSMELSRDMNLVLEEVVKDDDIKVVIVTGAGESFCAGMSLKEFYKRRGSLAEMAELRRLTYSWMEGLRVLPKPTIAAVNGWCFGGAFFIVAGCDIAVASEKAVFGLSEINWGGFPAGGALKSTTYSMTPKQAMYYTLTGDTFDGKEAARIGFVTKAVPHEELDKTVDEIAKKLYPHTALALEWAKKTTQRSIEIPSFVEATEYEMDKMIAFRQLTTEESLGPRWQAFMDHKYKPGLGTYEVPGESEGKKAEKK